MHAHLAIARSTARLPNGQATVAGAMSITSTGTGTTSTVVRTGVSK